VVRHARIRASPRTRLGCPEQPPGQARAQNASGLRTLNSRERLGPTMSRSKHPLPALSGTRHLHVDPAQDGACATRRARAARGSGDPGPPAGSGDVCARQWQQPAQPAQPLGGQVLAPAPPCHLAVRPPDRRGGAGPPQGVRHRTAGTTRRGGHPLGRSPPRSGRFAPGPAGRQHRRSGRAPGWRPWCRAAGAPTSPWTASGGCRHPPC